MRTCTIEGCDRAHRAKGYCASHYNAILKPDRHRTVITCEECGAEHVTTRTDGRYCSLYCRDAKSREHKSLIVHPDPEAVIVRPPVTAPAPTPPRPRFVSAACRWCGVWFISDAAHQRGSIAPTHCSRRCKVTHLQYRRRTRKRGAYVSYVRRVDVFARDGWRCQICHRKVSRTAKVPSPRAPTLDHIIPLALGGTHEPVNCQTACFKCNSTKSHVGTGDQLRLIA